MIAAVFISLNLFAQAPQKMSYQAVIRNASNILVTNAPVKMRISILQGSATGTSVYSELHSATTNANGLVSIEIGGGTSPTGTLSSINWGNGTYFLKTEADPNNGNNYSIVGTSQLLSVPYSLQSNNAGNGIKRVSASGDSLFLENGKSIIIPGISSANPTSPGTGLDSVYSGEAGYLAVLDKIYRSITVTGNKPPAGDGDVPGVDEVITDFLRQYWNAQELSTDEAVVAWFDPGLQDFHYMNWSSDNPQLKGLYYRCIFVIKLCSEFIRESTDGKLSVRGIIGDAANRVKVMKAEARFVRAFQYWVMMDLFANPVFINENENLGPNLPFQITRPELFKYIDSELRAIDPQLSEPRTAVYGRADKAAAWALRARLWLNAETYIPSSLFASWPPPEGPLTVKKIYENAVTFAERVINSGSYQLSTNYTWLFLADNNSNGSQNEFIWTINYDGIKAQNFGGTTFIVNASVGGNMDSQVSGLGAWGGLRTTKNLPLLFPDFSGTIDKRAQFVMGFQNLEIDNISEFRDGLAVIKFRNRTSTGGFGSDPDRRFADIDFPLFRLAEMYLIYAEGVARGSSNGSINQAVNYINKLRQRAYGNNSGDIMATDINLDFILNERSRELYWEGHRRTDLIRHNKFWQSTYLWPWKGGIKNGTGVAEFRKIYPIPDSEILSNPNIRQNPGY